jgi:hypothetical protein
MMQRPGRRFVLALVVMVALGELPGVAVVTRALQASDIFSPASGHAEVIAQGVATLPAQAAWRAVFYSVAPGSAAELPADGPGFVLVDTGGVLANETGASSLLAPTEAAFHNASVTRLLPLGDRPAGLFDIDLVPTDKAKETGDGIPVFASDPFAAPSGARDIDLVRDLLQPGESTTVIGNESPVPVLVTLGAVQVEATDGSTKSLKVGEAATFSGDVVVTAQGQAPATFVAAVIGREAPAAAATPGATPQAAAVGSVQVTVYACPPLVTAADASPGRCLRDPEAVALDLVTRQGGEQSVGPSGERDGLPTWTGLAGGEYVLRASEFKQGFGRFLVRGLNGVDSNGAQGYPAGDAGGYVIPISVDSADYSLEVYALATSGGATPATAAPSAVVPSPVASAAPSPASEPTSTPAGPTEIPSVIQVETAVPGSTPTATPQPKPTATPRPNATTEPKPQATARSIVSSTAVARPQRGTVTVRVWGCSDSIDTFDPADCAQSVSGYDVQLVSESGDIMGLDKATVDSDGKVTWKSLPLGTYVFQQPTMLPGAVTYYAPNLDLTPDNSGYVVSISADEPVATIDVYDLPAAASAAPTLAPSQPDSDGDGLSDADETNVYGTDPENADSDFDGVFDGQEVANGTDPLVADNSSIEAQGGAGDSDGDRLSDGDEAAFGTDPNNPDTDGDGWYDGDEVNAGTDPLDSSSVPVG